MFSKLRYGIVLLAGAVLLVLTLQITKSAVSTKENTQPSTNEQQSFAVLEREEKRQGNTEAHIDTSNFYSVTGGEAVPEASVNAAASQPDSGTIQTVQDEVRETEAPEETPAETEAVEDSRIEETPSETEAEKEVGLISWFKDKLIINEDKVKLYLNIREAPDEDSEILDVLYPDETATILRKDGAWYEVQRDGFTGFVKASYVLAGDDAYNVLKHTVSFGAVIMENETILYEGPDDSQAGIQLANKGDVFRVVGMEGSFFRLLVYSEIYETLYVRADQVFLYYLFLGPGNSNELDEATEAYLDSLDLEGNLERAYAVQAEAIEEQAAYEEAVQAYRAEKQKQEQNWNSQPAQPPAEVTPQPAPAPAPAESGNGSLEYIGNFRITHYCHCPLCCGVYGSWDPNYQATGSSGMQLVSNYSVAVNVGQIGYGTRLMINGKEYMAADTGVGAGCIDIYHQTHDEALAGGMCYADVYVIK